VTGPTESARAHDAVLAHLDAAYNLARWLVRDDHDAEDIVQDACVRALRSIDSLRGDNARPWLLAIVRNRCWDWLREHRRDEASVAYDDELHGAHATQDAQADADAAIRWSDPQAALQRAQERRLIDAALTRLPAVFREALVLRDIEDLSYREIARIADVPIGTVMSRLARGRKLMLRELAERAPERSVGTS
jgi:RNA polymerase sigma-70 factor (ECF subfamily)